MEDSYVLQLLKPKFKDFHLCFCGFAECEPLHSYGPAARPNYILHYVMKGKGIYQVGETKYQLKEGQAFLIEPESFTFYQADKTDPWFYLWVGFGGTEAQRFVRDLGLNSHQLTCECEYGEELKEIVFEMLRHTNSTAENLYYLQGKLYQFFSVLARGIEIQQYADDTKESIHVQEAIAYIQYSFCHPHQIIKSRHDKSLLSAAFSMDHLFFPKYTNKSYGYHLPQSRYKIGIHDSAGKLPTCPVRKYSDRFSVAAHPYDPTSHRHKSHAPSAPDQKTAESHSPA